MSCEKEIDELAEAERALADYRAKAMGVQDWTPEEDLADLGPGLDDELVQRRSRVEKAKAALEDCQTQVHKH